MKFINRGQGTQIRIAEKSPFGGIGYRWKLVKNGETIDLSENVGLANGLEKVTDEMKPKVTGGKVGDTKVETKQFENNYTPDDLFFEELKKIKGIGTKTAKDIVVWGTKEKLIEVIELKKHLPFRNDIEAKLKKKYGN